MSQKSKLLIFNFVMDKKDPLLSHQHQIVNALASEFDQVTVITGKLGKIEAYPNIRIIPISWRYASPVRNFFKLLVTSIPVILRGDFNSVFFHMTDVQCAILSPLIRLRGKKQSLWYAHTHRSIFLSFASWWISNVVTSTYGSCPIKGAKVIPIGQGIDVNQFKSIPFEKLRIDKLVHIGRFDKSKNIHLLIASMLELRKIFPEMNLALVGSPSNSESEIWANSIKSSSSEYIEEGWLQFTPAIPRTDFPLIMSGQGCFFHAYTGSLDKTLVEATLLSVPVVTINPEYLSIFGSWSGGSNVSLVDEYKSLRSLSIEELVVEIERRRQIAADNHSLSGWVKRLSEILQ